MVDAAEQRGIITQSGSYYSRGDVRLGHGKEKTLDYLRSNPEMQQSIREEVLASLNPSEGGTEELELDDLELESAILDLESPEKENSVAA